MRILLLGGTVFLGRHIVEAALAANHEVTLFNRGLTAPDLFPQAERLTGNRDGELAALSEGDWDAVVDTSGYVPRIVRQSVRRLAGAGRTYCFISSVSAYADFSSENRDETAETAKLEDLASEDVKAHYGALKALCEQEVLAGFGERALIVRPGLIVGPYDPTDRFTYWPERFAKGGETLVPGDPDRPVQWIDARDLAEWIIRMLERRAGGIYNAVTPAYAYTMGDLAEAGRRLAQGAPATPVWVAESFLNENGVGEWIELPLWIKGESGMPGFLTASSERAVRSGLTFRPLSDTLDATLSWAKSRDASYKPRAGMEPEWEAELLAKWHNHAKSI